MKTIRLLLLLLLLPMLAYSQATSGFHRTNQVIARSLQGVNAQVVPYATIVVTRSSDGTAATIYSDPGLTSPITGSTVTADSTGTYDYYVQLNYCVTENISSPGQGSATVPNICQNTTAGSGTVLSGASYKLPSYSSAASTTVGPSNITTDSTGNNLTVPGNSTTTGTAQGGTLTDGTASLHAGSLTGAVNGTFSNTVAANFATSYSSTSNIFNGWQRNVCGYPDSTYPTHGDKVRACIADAVAAGGGVCDSRCIDGTTTNTLGTLPIEVGTSSVAVTWHLPDSGILWVTQNGNNLPTPATPALTATFTTPTPVSGVYPMPPGTYWLCVAYQSGGGVSSCSTPTQFTIPNDTCAAVSGTTAQNCGGQVTIATPPSVAYAYTYNIYIGTTNTNMTWQANCLIDGSNGPCSLSYPLIVGKGAYPTAPTGVPAIIVHGTRGNGMYSDDDGYGFLLTSCGTFEPGDTACPLASTETMNVSNMIATEDENGQPSIHNVYVGSGVNRGTVTDSVVLLQNVFSQARIYHLTIGGLSNVPPLKIRSSNDLTFKDFNISCQDGTGSSGYGFTTNCGPGLELDNRFENTDLADQLHNLIFDGLNIDEVSPSMPYINIDGNPRPTAGSVQTGRVAQDITFLTPSLEFGNQSFSGGGHPADGFDITDAQGVSILNPNVGGRGQTILKLAESFPCTTLGIRMIDAVMGIQQTENGTASVLVNNTITGEVIPSQPSWNMQSQSFVWGSNTAAGCPTNATEYRRGIQINADPASVGGNAATSIVAGGAQYTTANLLANPGFEQSSSGSPTSWTTDCTGSGACTFTLDTSTYNSGLQSLKIYVNGSTSSTIDPPYILANYGEATQVISMTAGQTYPVSFWAKNDNAAIYEAVGINDGSHTYCVGQNFALTASWAPYSFQCTALYSGTPTVHFMTRTSDTTPTAGDGWIDDVMVGARTVPTYQVFGAAATSGTGVCPSGEFITAINAAGAPTCTTGAAGSVTSVALNLPAQFAVTGSPVTGSGTLSATWAAQSANLFFAGPATGSAAAPSFRAITAADVPTLNQSTTGNAATATQATNATNVNGGTVSATTGTFSDTVAAGATTPTTIGSNGVLLNGVPALQAQTSLSNYYSGGAGNLTGTGSYNTANGFQALYYNTTGSDNTANGYAALFSNTTGSYNTANGLYALYSNTTGSDNTANGYEALYSNTTGSDNTANGLEALNSNTTGSDNTANGYAALYANTTGNNNTANGYAALNYNTTGTQNTANGLEALYTNTTGSNNTANGYAALYYNTTGYNNTANGYAAGQYIADGVTANQTSSNSVYEGFQAYPLASGDTNENVIGNTAIGHGSNTTTLGNSGITDTYIAGSAHIAGLTTAGVVTTSAAGLLSSQTNAPVGIVGISTSGTYYPLFVNTLSGSVTTLDNDSSLTYDPATGVLGITQVSATNLASSALTPGNCVQAGTGGLLTTTTAPCSLEVGKLDYSGNQSQVVNANAGIVNTFSITGTTTTSAVSVSWSTASPSTIAPLNLQTVVSANQVILETYNPTGAAITIPADAILHLKVIN